MSMTQQLRDLLENLEKIEPDKFPAVIKKKKRRKKEEDAAWKVRAIEYVRSLIEAEEKNEEVQDLQVRESALIELERQVGDISGYTRAVREIPEMLRVLPERELGVRIPGPTFGQFQLTMINWVAHTLLSKEAEANCGLDCSDCPLPQLANCSLQNIGSAASDGYKTWSE